MTPEDVPVAITAASLFPWLHAIAAPVEPVRSLAPHRAVDAAADRGTAAPAPAPLRPAA